MSLKSLDPLPPGEWETIDALEQQTRDGATVRIYLDGQPDPEAPGSRRHIFRVEVLLGVALVHRRVLWLSPEIMAWMIATLPKAVSP